MMLKISILSIYIILLSTSPAKSTLEEPLMHIDENGMMFIKTRIPFVEQFTSRRNKASIFVKKVKAMEESTSAISGTGKPPKIRSRRLRSSVLKSVSSDSDLLRLRREIRISQVKLEKVLRDHAQLDIQRRFYEAIKSQFQNFGYLTSESTKKQILKDIKNNFAFSPQEIPVSKKSKSAFATEMIWLKALPQHPPASIYRHTPSAEALKLAIRSGELMKSYSFQKKWKNFDCIVQLKRLEKELEYIKALCLALQYTSNSEAVGRLHDELEKLGAFKYIPDLAKYATAKA